jgi:hypothetical protein
MRPRPRRPTTTPDTRLRRAQVHARIECRVSLAGTGVETRGWVKTLNTGGMSAWTDERLPAESECEVRLLNDGNPAEVVIQGWVVHANEHGLGIQFDDLTPTAELAVQRIAAPFHAPV